MKTSARLANGSATGYGMGLFLGRYRGIETLWHSGGGLGANSQMIKVPAVGLDITIMVNRHDVLGTNLANQVMDACITGLEPLKEGRTGTLVTGVYQSAKTGHVVQLRAQEDRQMLSYNGSWEIALERKTESTLSLSDGSMSIELLDSKNPSDRVRFSTRGWVDELTLLEPRTRVDPEAVVGAYRSAPTGTEVTIVRRDEEVVLYSHGRWGSTEYRLRPILQGICQAKMCANEQWSGLLLFDTPDTGFRFLTGRTWNLPFRRKF